MRSLRSLLSSLALLMPSRLMAQSDGDATIITGVVDGLGGGSGAQEADGSWTAVFDLVAWREGDGAIRTDELRVEVPNQSESNLSLWGMRIKAGKLVRFSISGPIGERHDRPLVQLQSLLAAHDDTELLAAADPILKPRPIVDAEFGEFVHDPKMPAIFIQEREWLGRTLDVSLELDYSGPPGPDAAGDALATLKSVWESREEWDARVREAIAEEYYQLWRDEWRNENEPILDREAFKARFVVDGPSFAPGGHFSFMYGDDDLFYGHSMWVTYRPEDGSFHVAMFG